jgi:hypothetical protein
MVRKDRNASRQKRGDHIVAIEWMVIRQIGQFMTDRSQDDNADQAAVDEMNQEERNVPFQ